MTLALTVATPTITPNGGNFSGSVSVAMQTATSGASIYYTMDGSTPTQSSTLYTGTMALANSATVNAKAFKSGSNPSSLASASFVNTGTGKTYYVAKTGSNSNTCTQAQNQSTPKQTVSAGVACMQSGDRLEIKQGTYEEIIPNPPSGTPSNRTVIATFGTDTVTFTANSAWNFYSGGFSYVDFIGGCTSGLNRTCKMIFDGTGTDAFGGAVPNASPSFSPSGAHHIRLDGVRVTNWGSVPSNISDNDAFVEIRNCRYDNNGKFLTAYSQAGYHFYIGGGNVLIENCELDHAGGYAIHQYTSDPSGGNNNIYRNNLIHDNGITMSANSADGILLYSNSSSHKVYNNIIYNHARGDGIRVVTCTNCAIYNNTVYNNSSGINVWSASKRYYHKK